MKHLFFICLFFFLVSINVKSQSCGHNHENLLKLTNHKLNNQKSLSNDTTFDVNFYHLDLLIALDSAYLQGNVSYLFTSNIDGLNSVVLDLEDNFIIDSVSAPASSYEFSDNELTIQFANTFDLGETFTFAVYYHGAPQLAGGYKGLRYETHNGDEPVIASLSTPYLAHTWWPCKDGVQDKSDSTFIEITIKDTLVSGLPLMAVSNGLLEAIETSGGYKTFKWKHYYPIVPFYVMVAISNYAHFQQSYEGPGYSFPIDYYVFSSQLEASQNGVAEVPEVMDFFIDKFGDYPFRNEKYGMTQLGFYGGIENQTNSVVGSMDDGWFNVTVHELAHQWFAGMVTCDSWNHAWLNEGFASYSEALYDEHANDFSSYQNYVSGFEFYDAGTVYLNDVTNPFSVFKTILYTKGAYVLHMLRGVLGDEVFFEAIKNYATNSSFQYKHATTEDFQMICENTSGQDLDYFFAQWIYDERYPIYNYNYDYDAATGNLGIEIHQTQSIYTWRDVFTMPIEIKVEFSDLTDTTLTVFNDSHFQYFSFEMDNEVVGIELDPNNWILKQAIFDENIHVGLPEITQDGFMIYPNPATRSVYIQSETERGEIAITLFDINGKSKLKRSFKSTQNGLYLLDLETLAPGIYLVEILTESTRHIKKLSVIDGR